MAGGNAKRPPCAADARFDHGAWRGPGVDHTRERRVGVQPGINDRPPVHLNPRPDRLVPHVWVPGANPQNHPWYIVRYHRDTKPFGPEQHGSIGLRQAWVVHAVSVGSVPGRRTHRRSLVSAREDNQRDGVRPDDSSDAGPASAGRAQVDVVWHWSLHDARVPERQRPERDRDGQALRWHADERNRAECEQSSFQGGARKSSCVCS
jgi:hypothetical protein